LDLPPSELALGVAGAGFALDVSVVGLSVLLFSVAGLSALLFSVPAGVVADSPLRLSVLYHPEPLKMIPTGWKTRRVVPPQLGQTKIGSSTTRCRISKRCRHLLHSYS